MWVCIRRWCRPAEEPWNTKRKQQRGCLCGWESGKLKWNNQPEISINKSKGEGNQEWWCFIGHSGTTRSGNTLWIPLSSPFMWSSSKAGLLSWVKVLAEKITKHFVQWICMDIRKTTRLQSLMDVVIIHNLQKISNQQLSVTDCTRLAMMPPSFTSTVQ